MLTVLQEYSNRLCLGFVPEDHTSSRVLEGALPAPLRPDEDKTAPFFWLTFTQVRGLALQFAVALRRRGFVPGERIGLA
jgi:hypothetical protein